MEHGKRELEVFFGPDYTAVIRPVPEDRAPRSMEKSISLIPHTPWPDYNVYLIAKGVDLTNWARANLNDIAACRIVRFVRTRDYRELATLTKLELDQLRDKAAQLGVPLDI